MAQCKALKKDGTPCKAKAVEGQEYCAFHLRLLGQKEVPQTEAQVQAEAEVAVRYTGRGFYWIAGYEFTRENPVQKVPEAVARFLLESQPGLFVPA